MKDGPKKHSAEELAHVKEHGYFDWKFTTRGKPSSLKVTQADLDEFAAYDASFLQGLSYSLSVLTCYALNDEVVPPGDCANFANVVPNHTLRLIPGATHTYKGKCTFKRTLSSDSVFMNHPSFLTPCSPRDLEHCCRLDS